MELRHLRYFVGVAEEQHFGRAAERLHVAQPALSRQIQALEKELGFLLFDRLPRGVQLSAAGAVFLDDARRILQDVDEAKRRAERIALGNAGTLRLGIAKALSWHGVIADSFREFRRRQPDVELVVHHLLSVHQADAVLSDRLEAGFAATMTPWHRNMAHCELARERLLLAVPKGHPLTKLAQIRLRDLRNLPFVGFQRWANPAFYDELMQACARGGLGTPHVVQEATDRDTQLGLVQCGIGVAWQTESIRWHCPKGIALLPVVDMKLRVPYNLIWRIDNASPLLRKFVNLVKEGRRASERLPPRRRHAASPING